MDRVYGHFWMTLDRETKAKLVKAFGIPKTGIAEVRNEELLSDGYTNDDLSILTKTTFENYTGKTGSFSELWELVLKKLDEPVVEKMVEIKPTGIMIAPSNYLDKKAWCDSCSSLGVRHKKDCPKRTF